MSLEIRRVTGDELLEVLGDVARLRIEVFREFPYLYAGCEDAEVEYLRHFSESKSAVVVVARDAGVVVGASTGIPMLEADEAFQTPLKLAGERLDDWFYCGESVLKKEFRGLGFGHRFFDEREAHAVELGFSKSTFCSVVRPEDHPLRAEGYRSLHAFWTKRGYLPRHEWRAKLAWRQIDSGVEEVENELVFWAKSLG